MGGKNQSESTTSFVPHDLLDLYRLCQDCLMVMVGDAVFSNPANRREYKALEQLADATQLLYAACVNSAVMVDAESDNTAKPSKKVRD